MTTAAGKYPLHDAAKLLGNYASRAKREKASEELLEALQALEGLIDIKISTSNPVNGETAAIVIEFPDGSRVRVVYLSGNEPTFRYIGHFAIREGLQRDKSITTLTYNPLLERFDGNGTDAVTAIMIAALNHIAPKTQQEKR